MAGGCISRFSVLLVALAELQTLRGDDTCVPGADVGECAFHGLKGCFLDDHKGIFGRIAIVGHGPGKSTCTSTKNGRRCICDPGECSTDGQHCVPMPTPMPTPPPTAAPTPEPTSAPTPEPTSPPTPEPTPEPTAEPTPEPTLEPTKPPPTPEPTPEPTAPQTPEPPAPPATPEPTAPQTPEPTAPPATPEPTAEATPQPTLETTKPPPTPEPTATGGVTTTDLWKSSDEAEQAERRCKVEEFMKSSRFETDFGICYGFKCHHLSGGQTERCCRLDCIRMVIVDQEPRCNATIEDVMDGYEKREHCPVGKQSFNMAEIRGIQAAALQPDFHPALVGGAVGAALVAFAVRLRRSSRTIEQPLLLA